MSKTISIEYGLLAHPLSYQLDAQGISYGKNIIKRFEKDVDAIATLRLGNHLLTDSMYDKILDKLNKKVIAHLKGYNKKEL